MPKDQVGLGWRKEIADKILSHISEIDVLEVILDDYFDTSRLEWSALETLMAQVPVVFHGVSLGLASAYPIEARRLKVIKQTLLKIQGLNGGRKALKDSFDLQSQSKGPQWSEHLAFVRAGEIEIGHLAAPPKNEVTLKCTLENLKKIEKLVGSKPLIENVASLVKPPFSNRSDLDWTQEVARESGCGLLLDLHNLYTNQLNYNLGNAKAKDEFDIAEVDWTLVKQIHLSGGRWVENFGSNGRVEQGVKQGVEQRVVRRWLDDHRQNLHPIQFDWLKTAARMSPNDLTVIIERDGNFPDFSVLREQLFQVREALKNGRAG